VKVYNITENDPVHDAVVFPGSFNPIHKHHIAMAQYAYAKYGKPVHLEISINNVDRANTSEDINNAINSLIKCDESCFGNIYLSVVPLFTQKALLFPSSTLIVGANTLQRINDYHLSDRFWVSMREAIIIFNQMHIRFLVFHRKGVNLKVIPELLSLCEIVPENELMDSSEIRYDLSRSID
jgi:hypothetical protein